jgi:hypothetical protein
MDQMAARDTADLSTADQLVITVNGPGEIAAWLYPFAHAVKARRPDLRICVCVAPCVFSSGAEAHVVESFETVDAVTDVAGSMGLITRNRLPEGFRRDGRTLVFHFGGEVALTHLIAKRLRAPVYGYFESKPGFAGRFARIFYSGLNTPPPQAEVVGELMVDAARLRRDIAPRRASDAPVIGVFPGSRDYMVRHVLPYFAAAVERLVAKRPELSFVVSQAPFIEDTFLEAFPPLSEDRVWEASAVRFARSGGRRYIETEAGVRMEIVSNNEALARIDYAVSLPGTNTGEMAAAGIPMLVVLPTTMTNHHIRNLPLPGLAGHVGRIPLLGGWLKRIAALGALRRTPILALPNRRAGREVVPELAGPVTPAEIAAALDRLLDADGPALRAEVEASMGAPGAADRLADAIVDYFSA